MELGHLIPEVEVVMTDGMAAGSWVMKLGSHFHSYTGSRENRGERFSQSLLTVTDSLYQESTSWSSSSHLWIMAPLGSNNPFPGVIRPSENTGIYIRTYNSGKIVIMK